MVIRCLTEGNSIRSTVRMTGASKNTINQAGCGVRRVCPLGSGQDASRNSQCNDLQLDEIWSFCGCKEKNKGTAKKPASRGHLDMDGPLPRKQSWFQRGLFSDRGTVPPAK